MGPIGFPETSIRNYHYSQHGNPEGRSYNIELLSLKRCWWKTNKYYTFWVSVCSLRYPACNAHAPYCHLSSAPLYHIFPQYLINSMFLGKKLLNTKCVFWFPVQLLSETFLILRRTERDMIKNVYRSACKVKRYSSPVTGLEWPRGFQEVKVPRFHDNGTGWW